MSLHLADRLGHRVQPAQPQRVAGERDVLRLRLGRGPRFEPGLGGLQALFQQLLDLIELLAGGGLIGLVDLAHPLLDRLQPPSLRAQELDPGLLQRIATDGFAECALRFGGQAIKLR